MRGAITCFILRLTPANSVITEDDHHLMSDPSLGTWLRKERERRGITIKAISEQTKVAAPLLEGLEHDNLTRWPDGIYRRAFVRAYASAVGLDPDEVCRRFDEEHGAPVLPASLDTVATVAQAAPAADSAPAPQDAHRRASRRARVLGTSADLTVALVLAMGSAAFGSRLLWPVLLIAAYYAVGVLLTGTSPMVALLLHDEPNATTLTQPEPASDPTVSRPQVERRHQSRRNAARTVRPARTSRTRVQ